jgi:hypothetical protein
MWIISTYWGMAYISPQPLVVQRPAEAPYTKTPMPISCKNYTPMPFNANSSPIQGSLGRIQDAEKIKR